MFKFLLRLSFFMIIATLSLEFVFRSFVPASEMPRGSQNLEYGIKHQEVSSPRSGLHTIGRFANPKYRWEVNEAGFNSAWEYRSAENRNVPCVAVVGHSYVEGLYSDVERHMAGRLQSRLDGRAEVYNLATSGMPLSQARRVVRYARDNFQPSTYVVFVGFSSLQASSRDLGFVPFAEQLEEKNGTFIEVGPSKMKVNKKKRLLARSAIIRYLFYNANVTFGGGQKVIDRNLKGEIVDNSDQEFLTKVTDHILAGLRKDVPDANIVLVCDSDRTAMYKSKAKPEIMMTNMILEEVCPKYDIKLVDLTDPFWQEYKTTGRLLNFRDNYHWDPATVDLVAKTIVESVGVEFMLGQ